MRQLRKRLAKFIRNKRQGMTLRQFSARYSISRATIQRIEQEEQNVSLDTLEHFCKVFRCDIDQLFK